MTDYLHEPEGWEVIQLSTLPHTYVPDTFNAPRIYRFFERTSWAHELTAGLVYVNTLDSWRRIEGAARGDAGEASILFQIKEMVGSCTDPVVRRVAERAGYRFGPGVEMNVRIPAQDVHRRILDAYGFCAANSLYPEIREDFGEYGVVIENPRAFFRHVTKALHRKLILWHAHFAPVRYDRDAFAGDAALPVGMGYFKPKSYERQREVRMLWHPLEAWEGLEPLKVEVPAIRRLCKRI